jgi:hypothetical protein
MTTRFGRGSAIIRTLQGMTSAHSMGSHFVTLKITEYQYEINYIKYNKNRIKMSSGLSPLIQVGRCYLEDYQVSFSLYLTSVATD